MVVDDISPNVSGNYRGGGSNISSLGYSESTLRGNANTNERAHHYYSSISRGIGNKATNAGITRGEEDSSALVSQTHGIKELDIDVEFGGQVSDSVHSSAFRLP